MINHLIHHTKNVAFILLLASSLSGYSQSKTDSSKNKTLNESRGSIGYNINRIQNDFGLGLNYTSPYFLHQTIALRLSGNLQWLQSIDPTTSVSSWTPYAMFKLGVLGISSHITKGVRAYCEGGVVLIVPNKAFSDKSVIMGGYGIFGFEFAVSKKFNYYIELGGIGTGAVAEKSLFKPIYSNGFTSSVGFRIKL